MLTNQLSMVKRKVAPVGTTFSAEKHIQRRNALLRVSRAADPRLGLGESTSVEFPIDQITGFKVVKFTLWLFNIAMV